MQAAEALKLLSGVGESLSGRLQWLDVRTMQWRSVNVQRDPECPVADTGPPENSRRALSASAGFTACYWPCGQCMD